VIQNARGGQSDAPMPMMRAINEGGSGFINKKMTPNGGYRWGQSWLDTGLGGNVRVQLEDKIRIELRHDNTHSQESPPLAMHKTGNTV
jgi:hypothetical protein